MNWLSLMTMLGYNWITTLLLLFAAILRRNLRNNKWLVPDGKLKAHQTLSRHLRLSIDVEWIEITAMNIPPPAVVGLLAAATAKSPWKVRSSANDAYSGRFHEYNLQVLKTKSRGVHEIQITKEAKQMYDFLLPKAMTGSWCQSARHSPLVLRSTENLSKLRNRAVINRWQQCQMISLDFYNALPACLSRVPNTAPRSACWLCYRIIPPHSANTIQSNNLQEHTYIMTSHSKPIYSIETCFVDITIGSNRDSDAILRPNMHVRCSRTWVLTDVPMITRAKTEP